MSPDQSKLQFSGSRAWLEEAIAASNAALSPNLPEDKLEAKDPARDGANQTNGHTRKLTTVRHIKTLAPLNKKYQVAVIDGWKVVVEKSKGFCEGNLVIFLEVDAFLPARTRFESLFAQVGPLVSFNDEEGYRVGTSTWKDSNGNEVVSQGYIFHLSDFPDIGLEVSRLRCNSCNAYDNEGFANYMRVFDFSDMLGVKKFEYVKEEAGITDVNNDDKAVVATAHPKPPRFVLKTSMERVQNCPNLFIKKKYERFIFQESVKLDGASISIYFVPTSAPQRPARRLHPQPGPAPAPPPNSALPEPLRLLARRPQRGAPQAAPFPRPAHPPAG
ncbi:hypothetical protein VTK26DRAFT_2659 [Humicola hyalothermophila]